MILNLLVDNGFNIDKPEQFTKDFGGFK